MAQTSPKGGVNVTRIVLFLILAVLAVAAVWDRYARGQVDTLHTYYMGEIQEDGTVVSTGEIDKQNRASVSKTAAGSDKSTLETSSFITPESVREKMGRAPTDDLAAWEDKGVQTENYVWAAGFPGRSYNLLCLYQPYTTDKKEKKLRLVRVEKNISLDQLDNLEVPPPATEDAVSETPSLEGENPKNNPKLQPPGGPARTPETGGDGDNVKKSSGDKAGQAKGSDAKPEPKGQSQPEAASGETK